MTIGKWFLTGIGFSSVLVVCACSHEWDALDPPVGESSSSAGSAGTASSTSVASSGSGAGGSGGGGAGTGGAGTGGTITNACAPLLPPVARCGNVVGVFDDPVKFDADWYLAAGSGSIQALNGVADITLDASDDTAFAATHADFKLQSCAIWVEIVELAGPTDVMVRLSLSAPFAQSRYSVGVLDKNLEVHIDGASISSTPYDATQMRYVRMREEGGDVYFGHSADGRCWTEIDSAPNTLMADVEGRIAVTRIPAGAGSAANGKLDNYCVDPP